MEQPGRVYRSYSGKPHSPRTSPVQARMEDPASRFEASTYKDIVFAVIFVLALGGVAALCATQWKGSVLFNPDPHRNDPQYQNLGINGSDLKHLYIILGSMIGAGAVFSMLWLWLLYMFPKQIIWFAFIANLGLIFALAAYSFYVGAFVGGIIALVVAAAGCAFLYFFRWRIAFSAQVIKTTVLMLSRHLLMVFIPVAALFVAAIVSAVWTFAFSCAAAPTAGVRGLQYVFLLLTFYWTTQVIKNVVHTSASGVYATEYFLGGTGAMPTHPIGGSLRRALTYSFGSICFGSLIVAALETLRALISLGRQANNGNIIVQLLAMCADCCLGIIDNLVQYFNIYAYTQIAIYGKSYVEAAKDTWRLFKTHGIDIIVNDDFSGTALSLACFMVALLTGGVGLLWATVVFTTDAVGLLWAVFILSFLIGYVEAMVVLEVVRSGIATVFVCFAEAPDVLRMNDPDLYNAFMTTYGGRIGFTSSAV